MKAHKSQEELIKTSKNITQEQENIVFFVVAIAIKIILLINLYFIFIKIIARINKGEKFN